MSKQPTELLFWAADRLVERNGEPVRGHRLPRPAHHAGPAASR
jgi:hypothetical protein